jgi:polyphosphate kinase
VADEFLRQQIICILAYNLRDNVNAYRMNEDGSYLPIEPGPDEDSFNIHEAFFELDRQKIMEAQLWTH